MPRPLDDLGPDFDRRWKQAPRAQRRELIASLRDLYLMLEDKDQALLTLLHNGKVPSAYESADIPLLQSRPRPAVQQGSLFTDAGTATDVALAPAPAEPARKENPFLPRSVLDRLQESRSRASAGLRDLIQNTAEEIARRPVAVGLEPAAEVEANDPPPPSHEQSDLERELRLKLGPVVEHLIEAQVEALKNELRVRLRLEMDRLIAEHVRK
ncbi:MAG: hypothetical protein K0S46_201 [Moraxellaceae bacterium]|jgi:hypothetical protein|nr:hypothetical protein [Moraxellaceae bacterium]